VELETPITVGQISYFADFITAVLKESPCPLFLQTLTYDKRYHWTMKLFSYDLKLTKQDIEELFSAVKTSRITDCRISKVCTGHIPLSPLKTGEIDFTGIIDQAGLDEFDTDPEHYKRMYNRVRNRQAVRKYLTEHPRPKHRRSK
jgi:hypothetical protein